MSFVYLIVFLVLYSLSSIVWGFFAMGRNPQPDKWYDWVLSLPTLFFLYLASLTEKTPNRKS